MSYPVNPNQIIEMIRSGKNPQQLMLSILAGQAGTPLGANLLNLAQNGQTAEIEKVARNLYAQQGGTNFDEDFKAFKQQLGFK